MSRSSICFVFASAVTAWAAGPASAQVSPPGLDADVTITVSTSTGLTYNKPGHYYRSHDGRTREDSPTGSVITDLATGQVTLLNSATRQATVISVAGIPRAPGTAGAAAAAADASAQGIGAFMPFGQAQIEGHAVTKARANAAGGAVQELWTATDLSLVVYSMVASTDRTMTRTLRNVAVRDPDPAVFQIPAGYTVEYMAAPVPPAAGRVPAAGRAPAVRR